MKVADAASNERANPATKSKLGLTVRPLSEAEKSRADVAEGLIVENVAEGPAANAGVRPGDIILSVNGEKLTSAAQLRSLVEKKSKFLALQLLRNDRKIFVPINVG
jgi:serine protease Do